MNRLRFKDGYKAGNYGVLSQIIKVPLKMQLSILVCGGLA